MSLPHILSVCGSSKKKREEEEEARRGRGERREEMDGTMSCRLSRLFVSVIVLGLLMALTNLVWLRRLHSFDSSIKPTLIIHSTHSSGCEKSEQMDGVDGEQGEGKKEKEKADSNNPACWSVSPQPSSLSYTQDRSTTGIDQNGMDWKEEWSVSSSNKQFASIFEK